MLNPALEHFSAAFLQRLLGQSVLNKLKFALWGKQIDKLCCCQPGCLLEFHLPIELIH